MVIEIAAAVDNLSARLLPNGDSGNLIVGSCRSADVIGAKPPRRPCHVWSIRTKLQIENRRRDLAPFNLAIDSKLRGCDVVAIRVDDVAPAEHPIADDELRAIKRYLATPRGSPAMTAPPRHWMGCNTSAGCLLPNNGYHATTIEGGGQADIVYFVFCTRGSRFSPPAYCMVAQRSKVGKVVSSCPFRGVESSSDCS
jgi:hypothetical protein